MFLSPASIRARMCAVLVMLAWAGCTATAEVFVGPVVPAEFVYAPVAAAGPVTLAVVDARSKADKEMHVGDFVISVEGMPDEIAYLTENVQRELQAHGVDVRSANADEADLVLKVLRFRIRNREGAFGPYHTFTTFRADLVTKRGSFPVAAYFKASKTGEADYTRAVSRPCYQMPMDSVVGEVAAKINRYAIGRVAPAEEVERLVRSVPAGTADAQTEHFRKVLQLGYTNNPAAVGPLVALTGRREVLMRGSAISALGTLGATDQFDLLRQMYEREGLHARLMAIKSIGDLQTPESRAFLDGLERSSDHRSPLVREVVELYD